MELPLGWVDFENRTDEQNATHNAIVAKMPAFTVFGDIPPVGTKVLLTDTWKSDKVVAAFGRPFTGWHQDTGSCVGVGGGNGAQTCNFVDAIIEKEPEKIVLIAWPYNYGRSRQLGGMRGRGQGSFGSTFAKSLGDDGAIDWSAASELPKYTVPAMYKIGSAAEMEWSDGTRASQQLRTDAKPHTVTFAPLTSGAQVRDSIVNGYAVTRAFNTFVNPNTAKVRNGALIGSYNGRGGHQESWLGYWNHPQEGELIWEQNQWGQNAYGTDPGGGPLGGCWIRIEEVDRQCRSQYAEIYSLSNYEGYPARPEVFDWATQSFWS